MPHASCLMPHASCLSASCSCYHRHLRYNELPLLLHDTRHVNVNIRHVEVDIRPTGKRRVATITLVIAQHHPHATSLLNQEPLTQLLFETAHPRKAQQHVPFALGAISTTSERAQALQRGREEKYGLTVGTMADSSASLLVQRYARTGSGQLAVPPPTTPNVTSAQGAEKRIMELRTALELRRLNALTPYKHKAWAKKLRVHNLTKQYPTICHGLRYGFDAGIRELSETYAPANNISLDAFPDAYHDIVNNEFIKGCYLGPCSQREVEELIGPFQSSPLSIIPKPHKPGKFRAVHNFSAPHTPQHNTSSINSTIDITNFPCTWGTFLTVALLISHLPPGSQASVRDTAEAYRGIPIKPSQWTGLVVRLQGKDNFAINTSNNFGLTSAGGCYGLLADAGTDIIRCEGIGPLSKWVDDHIFFRIKKEYLANYNAHRQRQHLLITQNGGRQLIGSRIWYRGDTMEDGRAEEFDEDNSAPLRDFSANAHNALDATFSYSDVDIDRISTDLGIPWESSKTIPFTTVIPYLGLSWDLEAKTVALSDTKKEKYRNCITEWQNRSTHTLTQVQSLYGKLLHLVFGSPVSRLEKDWDWTGLGLQKTGLQSWSFDL